MEREIFTKDGYLSFNDLKKYHVYFTFYCFDRRLFLLYYFLIFNH